MPTEDECELLHQRVEVVEKSTESKFQDLHSHIRELRADFSDHVEEQTQRHDDFMKASMENTNAINKLTESTQGLVEAWTAANGAVKVVSLMGRIIKWAAGIGAAITALWVYTHSK